MSRFADPRFEGKVVLVTGAASGIGKSTVCARLAGTIASTVLLDADILADDLISVVPPNQDYPAFWRSMMRLAHELAQNDVTVVYFSTMLPEQVLVNTDELAYFHSAHFLCLTCPSDVLHERITGRAFGELDPAAPVNAIINDLPLARDAQFIDEPAVFRVGRGCPRDRLVDDSQGGAILVESGRCGGQTDDLKAHALLVELGLDDG